MSCEDTAKEIIGQISVITTDIKDLRKDINALRQDKIDEIRDIRNATIRCLMVLATVASSRVVGGNRTKRARKTKKLTNRVKY